MMGLCTDSRQSSFVVGELGKVKSEVNGQAEGTDELQREDDIGIQDLCMYVSANKKEIPRDVSRCSRFNFFFRFCALSYIEFSSHYFVRPSSACKKIPT